MEMLFNRFLALIILAFTAPLWPMLFILVQLDSKGAFIFSQTRAGINKKPFTMYKIRTMVKNAEKLKIKYEDLNEADGPVFKIKDDPRFTKVGKTLAKTALDELPQLINVLRGEMALVGPRPLPISEAKKIPDKYSLRFSVLPGMTSLWVIKGNHKMRFKKWMELDIYYVKNKSLGKDLTILWITLYQIVTKLLISTYNIFRKY